MSSVEKDNYPDAKEEHVYKTPVDDMFRYGI